MALQQISTSEIADGTVIAADIAAGAVTGDKLGLTAINANNIVDGAITASKLAAGAALPSQSGNSTYYLTSDGTNAIWKAQTALTISGSQLTNGTVTQAKLDPSIDLGVNPLLFAGQ